MKNLLLFGLVYLAFAQHTTAQGLNLMTFNIRYATPQDGDNQWLLRKENLCSMLRYYEADVCGMQEALIGQIRDVQSILPEYNYVGKGRDDGQEGGEFSPIFYRKDKVLLLETQTFWLSQTPDAPSKGWDASFNRVVTWAKFRTTGRPKRVFYVFNTHFDHRGEVARRESAKLLLRQVMAIAGNAPAIIMGDFNAKPSDEPIRILLDPANPEHLNDTRLLSQTPHFGPQGTFNGFQAQEQDKEPIDHIFLKNSPFAVLRHATLSHTWGGRFVSDHHAVLTTLSLRQ